jgi:Flp pilus assembly pilin Flp
VKELIARCGGDEQGQDLIEYALLASAISGFLTTAVTSVGAAVNTHYERLEDQLATWMP